MNFMAENELLEINLLTPQPLTLNVFFVQDEVLLVSALERTWDGSVAEHRLVPSRALMAV